ncbi:unnamed protein product, partial [Oppiella nova]
MAISHILLTNSSCDESNVKNNMYFTTNTSALSLANNEAIGPRTTFWVLLMSGITVLSLATIAFIGISKIRHAHRIRMSRPPGALDTQSVHSMTDEQLFGDDYMIMPSGRAVIRDIRH